MVFQTEKSIKDLGDKIDSKEKEEAEGLIKDLKEALEKDDIEDIKTKKEKLSEKAMALATKVYENIQKERVIWDISVIAYMINRNWFKTTEVSCTDIKDDTSYEITENNHKITFVTELDRDKIYENLLEKL